MIGEETNLMGLFNKKRSIGRVDSIYEDEVQARIDIFKKQKESVNKSVNKKESSVVDPTQLIGTIDVGRGYRMKGDGRGGQHNIHMVLKELSTNIIVNSIITTRANQVARYCVPAKEREDSIGFEVVPKDNSQVELTSHDVANITRIEEFIKNTGEGADPSRDNFRQISKKWVRDILTYDQLNAELIYNTGVDSSLFKFQAVDASSMFHAVDAKTHTIPKGKNAKVYVQVLEEMIQAEFMKEEMIFESMNPRSDIYARGYGLSPLEVSMNHVGYHHMTELFNSKYFSQGGTTMGLLHIKTGENSTSRALEDFRRDWQQKFTGVNGSWKIPVVSAEDVKYVNMNQSSRDMEFEKWLNYLINVLCANYGIDPAEINFPNRGGATGSKGNSLQESSKKETSQLSKDKGLSPILQFIEDVMNKNIMPRLGGGKYLFRFTGDSIDRELQQVELLLKELESFKTLNEARKERGLEPVEGGDIILSAFHIQRIGQLYQKEQMDRQMQMEQAQMMQDNTGDATGSPDIPDSGEDSESSDTSVQDVQEGVTGKEKAKDTQGTKKDGQVRDVKSSNGYKENGKED